MVTVPCPVEAVENVNLQHAIVVSLVGWYLMMPPTAADLDTACNGQSVFWAVVGTFSSQTGRDSEMQRCDHLRYRLDTDAPLSKWHQVGEFENLAACQARYDENQKPLTNEAAFARWTARDELINEGKPHPSDEEVSARAQESSAGISAQTAGETCFASDDPRLAK